jgi:hypothetical protein
VPFLDAYCITTLAQKEDLHAHPGWGGRYPGPYGQFEIPQGACQVVLAHEGPVMAESWVAQRPDSVTRARGAGPEADQYQCRGRKSRSGAGGQSASGADSQADRGPQKPAAEGWDNSLHAVAVFFLMNYGVFGLTAARFVSCRIALQQHCRCGSKFGLDRMLKKIYAAHLRLLAARIAVEGIFGQRRRCGYKFLMEAAWFRKKKM